MFYQSEREKSYVSNKPVSLLSEFFTRENIIVIDIVIFINFFRIFCVFIHLFRGVSRLKFYSFRVSHVKLQCVCVSKEKNLWSLIYGLIRKYICKYSIRRWSVNIDAFGVFNKKKPALLGYKWRELITHCLSFIRLSTFFKWSSSIKCLSSWLYLLDFIQFIIENHVFFCISINI